MPKHLGLLRHAKSSWSDPRLADHDRPLNQRGRRAASRLGDYLRERAIDPDLVLCSTAVRARQTLDLLGLPRSTEVLVERELYGADAEDLLDRLRTVGAATTSVLVIGHNPGIHEAAILFAAEPKDLAEKFPTAALAELELPIESWGELAPGMGRLHGLVTPKSLE